jgi:hypothetical protein
LPDSVAKRAQNRSWVTNIDFSLERLMRFLTALHQDVRIVVEEKPRRGRGRVIVEAA